MENIMDEKNDDNITVDNKLTGDLECGDSIEQNNIENRETSENSYVRKSEDVKLDITSQSGIASDNKSETFDSNHDTKIKSRKEDRQDVNVSEENNNLIPDIQVSVDESVKKGSDENQNEINAPKYESNENNTEIKELPKEEISSNQVGDVKEDEDFMDILGNGLLTKKTLKKGLGRETRPSHGDKVTIEYEAYNSSDNLFESETVNFIVGDGDMIQAFDLGICLAEKLEEFELKTDARFAYGVHGNLPNIQPNEALKFKMKLLSVDDAPDFSTYLYNDRLEEVDKKRERGNYFYRREDYSLAVNSYSKALKIINTDPEFKSIATNPSKEELYDLFVKVTNNLAAAQLKLESYDSVIETCNSILEYQPNNVKALFRKGKSLSNKGNYEEAIVVLKVALSLETNSKLISNELMRCTTLKKQENDQRARICRKMFQTGNSTGIVNGKDDLSTFGKFKKMTITYSPYVAAVIVTGISITFAYLSISKPK